jgi:uncharacterized membrane protein
MNFFSRFRTPLIVVALIIVAFLAYSIFFTGESEGVLSESSQSATASVDNELIALLLQLKSLTLDESLFGNAAFQSLQDLSQELIPEPVGRNNPFAPLGSGQ